MNIGGIIKNASRFDTAFARAKTPRINGGSDQLYARWREVLARGRSELALVEAGSGRRWTFQELADEAEADRCRESLAFPRGSGAEFVIALLRAWRAGAISAPLETGQAIPALGTPPEFGAHLKFTSASTGPAKAVLFTAGQLAADARNIVATMGLSPDRPNLAAISLAHSYGFSNLVLPLLLHGIPLIVAPAPLPESILRTARHAKELTIAAVPALWRTWHAGGAIPENTRLAISAGAPLPLDLERAVFAERGIKIRNFYGSTECGGIAYDRSDWPREDSSVAGSALDGVRLSIAESGVLVVEGEAVGESYWPERNAPLGGGRFVTSDLAELAEGRVRLRGRTSDFINIAGRKIAPDRIEAALRRHPDVIECVVFGVPDSRSDRGETIVAAVHCRSAPGIAGLSEYLSRHLPNWQIPREWWFTAELAPNARGKIPRSEWREKYARRGPS